MVFKKFYALKMRKDEVRTCNDIKYKLFTDLDDLKLTDIIAQYPDFTRFELFKLDGENLKIFLTKYL